MKTYYKNILENYIINTKGTHDRHETRGGYGFSFNYSLHYICIYSIEPVEKPGIYYINDMPHDLEDATADGYQIKEIFFDSGCYADLLGRNFLDNTLDTQFKRIRKILNAIY